MFQVSVVILRGHLGVKIPGYLEVCVSGYLVVGVSGYLGVLRARCFRVSRGSCLRVSKGRCFRVHRSWCFRGGCFRVYRVRYVGIPGIYTREPKGSLFPLSVYPCYFVCFITLYQSLFFRKSQMIQYVQ